MADFLDIINTYGMPFMLIGQFLLAFAMVYLKGQFAPRSLENKVSDNHSSLDLRVTIIENRMGEMPSIKQLHELEREMSDLRGDLKRVDENLEGTEGLLERLERQVNRMDDFLKRT